MKQMDKLEMIVQAFEYERDQPDIRLDDFFRVRTASNKCKWLGGREGLIVSRTPYGANRVLCLIWVGAAMRMHNALLYRTFCCHSPLSLALLYMQHTRGYFSHPELAEIDAEIRRRRSELWRARGQPLPLDQDDHASAVAAGGAAAAAAAAAPAKPSRSAADSDEEEEEQEIKASKKEATQPPKTASSSSTPSGGKLASAGGAGRFLSPSFKPAPPGRFADADDQEAGEEGEEDGVSIDKMRRKLTSSFSAAAAAAVASTSSSSSSSAARAAAPASGWDSHPLGAKTIYDDEYDDEAEDGALYRRQQQEEKDKKAVQAGARRKKASRN